MRKGVLEIPESFVDLVARTFNRPVDEVRKLIYQAVNDGDYVYFGVSKDKCITMGESSTGYEYYVLLGMENVGEVVARLEPYTDYRIHGPVLTVKRKVDYDASTGDYIITYYVVLVIPS